METKKLHNYRLKTGWYDKYIKDKDILDTGYAAGENFTDFMPGCCKSFQGVDHHTKNYDGLHLPFENNSFDVCYSSHCLEDVSEYKIFIQEQFRVCKVGGHVIIVVPHYKLYEKIPLLKRENFSSKFNGNHKRSYSGNSLMMEIEESILKTHYSVINFETIDEGYDYSIIDQEKVHPIGNFSIEVVLEKLK
jgi:SAM-dependent methyltransferase